ncbi:TolC family outer membrane protein [Pseudomonas sp. PDNC002]|uniref:TolC family outer membrane protein n=1 Tax=Pseudomonas sp. PDNC002 TaxID=2811422 RepID=UPI0019648585|nr:TolC family outer membrane protein [Pseudomonas sp. PDNC002]QRY78829.1 TolC family outer membrane protein [Pseudomonas sp. PDNC002]
MRSRNAALWSGVFLAVSGVHGQAMTLTEAIQSTLQYHPEISQSVNSRLTADEELKFARGGYLPTVDLLLGYGRENTDSPSTRAIGNHNDETMNRGDAEIRLRQMLFDGFGTPNEVKRNEANVNSKAYRILGTSETAALRTVEVYLEVLKRREMVTLARNNLQAHERIGDQIRLRSERGVGSTADNDQAIARLALAQNNLYTEEVNLADAEANFYSATGKMPDQLESPSTVKADVPPDLLQARQSMLNDNPLLKSAQADVNAAESQYEAAKAPFYPRFDAELAKAANNNVDGDEGHYNYWEAQVVMRYNLFNGMRDKAHLNATSHQINESKDVRNNALRLLNENLSLAWDAMENSRKQTQPAREYADYTRKVREAYQQQFTLGQRTLLDLLDSENELFTANRRYTEVRYTEEFSMYRVLASMGYLLKTQHVVAPHESVALSEVKNEARLPELK